MYSFRALRSQIFCPLLVFLSTSAFATDGHVYLGGAVGASQLTLGNSDPQINYYGGLLNDAYPASSNHATTALFALQSGYEFTGMSLWPAIALGLGLYTTPSESSYHGQLVETALDDAPSALYNYNFNITSTRLMAEAQFTWAVKHFMPFVNVGIGPAWTQTNGYSETSATPTGYSPLPSFQNRTSMQFAYQAGLGLAYAFNFAEDESGFQHERVSLGYRYVNLGNISSGTRGSMYPYKLNLGNVSSNEVYLAFTHLF